MAHAGRPPTKLQMSDAERAELNARLRVRLVVRFRPKSACFMVPILSACQPVEHIDSRFVQTFPRFQTGQIPVSINKIEIIINITPEIIIVM